MKIKDARRTVTITVNRDDIAALLRGSMPEGVRDQLVSVGAYLSQSWILEAERNDSDPQHMRGNL